MVSKAQRKRDPKTGKVEGAPKPQQFIGIENKPISKEQYDAEKAARGFTTGGARLNKAALSPVAAEMIAAENKKAAEINLSANLAAQGRVTPEQEKILSEQEFTEARAVPESVPLKQDIIAGALKETPVGGLFTAKDISGTLRKIKNEGITSIDPETIEALQLNDLDLQNLAEGQANVNKLSQLIEGFPLIGKLRIRVPGFNFGIADLTGTSPSKKVQELKNSIDKSKELIQSSLSSAQENPALAVQYKNQAQDQYNEILKLESRLKLTAIQSPEIQADPQIIKDIMKEITEIKQVSAGTLVKFELMGV